MRDDAVLGRALPLDRGLGPKSSGEVNKTNITLHLCLVTDSQQPERPGNTSDHWSAGHRRACRHYHA